MPLTDLTPETRLVAAPGQVSCELGGETAILRFTTGVYYSLNSVGARVWKFLGTPRTVSQICDTILAGYEVEPEQGRREILELLDELHEAGLIELQ